MLRNAKPMELIKYSKGQYDKELFIQSVKFYWELTDKQIRMTFLIADLAVNAEGVFSVSNEKFREMFEARFKMTISRSTVIRFFQLLEELELLSVHEARRKNKQQSANIFIIDQTKCTKEDLESLFESNEKADDIPYDTAVETLDDTHNIAFNKDLNKIINHTVVNNIVNNNDTVDKIEIIDNLTSEYMGRGLTDQVISRVVSEVEQTANVKNFGGYLRTCLANTLHKVELKLGKVNNHPVSLEQHTGTHPIFYNWLDERADPVAVASICNDSEAVNSHPLFYDWVNA